MRSPNTARSTIARLARPGAIPSPMRRRIERRMEMNDTMPNRPKPGELWLGGCPHCDCNDGMINIGKSHWVYCKTHMVRWTIGTNIFSGWRDQTEAEQRRIFHELGFGDFEKVE